VVAGLGERYRYAAVTVVRHSEIVDAPPDEVWRVIADPRNLPRWNRHIAGVDGAPNGLVTAGDRYTTELRVMGLTLRVQAQVVESEAPRYARVAISGPLEATVRTRVRPVAKGRSRLDHEIDYRFRGGPAGALLARSVRLLGAATILKRGMRAQKRQVEG
jgi:uncharacterized membrane protein